MLQLTYALVFTVIAATCALWVFVLYKLLPLYKAGTVAGGYRTAFQVAVALLSWVSMQIVVWLLMGQDAAAMMLTVLWAIGLLSWLTLTTVARTRRQVRAETAQPQPLPSSAGPQGYKVRTRPHVTATGMSAATGPRSARVRRIQGMEA